MKYKFELPIHIVVKKNNRPIFKNKKTGKIFLGKNNDQSSFERDAIFILNAQRNCHGISKPLSGNLRLNYLRLEFVKSQRADLDNILTSVFDAIQGAGIINNDKQFKFVTNISCLENMGKDNAFFEIEQYLDNDVDTVSSFLSDIRAKMKK